MVANLHFDILRLCCFENVLFNEEVKVKVEYVSQRGAMPLLENYVISGIFMHVTQNCNMSVHLAS
jgi:hypothetical protein